MTKRERITDEERIKILKQVEDWARVDLEMTCEKPCDSNGWCENCNEVSSIIAGAGKAISIINSRV